MPAYNLEAIAKKHEVDFTTNQCQLCDRQSRQGGIQNPNLSGSFERKVFGN